MNKLDTMSLKGNEYATVPTRIKAFRETNPNASIETEPQISDDQIIFKATIIANTADPNSPRATGHSMGKAKDDKAFEKLETVAVGRALAILGYLNNGQVATTEEMDEFNQYRADQETEVLQAATTTLKAAKTIKDLRAAFVSLNPKQRQELSELKDQLKIKLEAKQ